MIDEYHPYWIALCKDCGGINGMCRDEDGEDMLRDWRDAGREYHNVAFAPKMSCTCPTGHKSYDQYRAVQDELRGLFSVKNTNYGDSWREMRFTTILDLMHAKVHRIEQLLKADIVVVEGIEDSLKDIANYAQLALIQYREKK